MKHRPVDVAAFRETSERLGVTLGDDEAGRLLEFERLLRDRAIPLGIVAASDEPRLRERHLLDCLRAAAVVGPTSSAYDLGSGAGLPGIVLAIAVPSLAVGLIESRRRRVSFLELAIQELGLANARVIHGRAQDVGNTVELCVARAFAPPAEAWTIAASLLVPGGRLVYFAGASPGLGEPPADAQVLEVPAPPVLESAGPLVIMTRQ